MRTVYIIGAGASYEAGLPTGNMLKSEIAKLLKFGLNSYGENTCDPDIHGALSLHTKADQSPDLFHEYAIECQHISANMPLAISIDNFIDSQRENEKLALCGKLAITKSILKAEKGSKLFFDPNRGQRRLDFLSIEKTWYLSFFRAITENCSLDDVASRFQNITLIIFNYDRCIEHFLQQALISYYRLSSEKAASLITNLNIIHPYGTVGSLAWLNPNGSLAVDFGGELHLSQLVKYANGIRTFTEGAHSNSMELLELSMRSAERLIFLGFAFHRLNMKLIRGSGSSGYENSKRVKCYATAFETSDSDQEVIRNSISYLYRNNVDVFIENTKCHQLFEDYSRSLGFA